MLWPLLVGVIVWLCACTNNPYPEDAAHEPIFYTSFVDPPKTLDPAVAYSTNEHEITGNVMDTLLEYHYTKRPYQLIPGLAQAVPEPESLDGTRVRYRFELRPDLLFQNDPCFALSKGATIEGACCNQPPSTRNITSRDFAFELARLADPAVNSPAFQSFLLVEGFGAFRDALQKAREASDFAALPVHEQYARLGGIPGVGTPDAQTLDITLTEPYPQILYWFAMPFTTPMPWEAVQCYDGHGGCPSLADHPVGSGPYAMTQYEKQSVMVMEKNPNWYGVRHPEWRAPGATYPSEGEPSDPPSLFKDAGKPLPFIERIEMRREKEGIPRFNKFLQGYYDSSAIISESFDKVITQDRLSPEMEALGMELEKSVVPDIFYVGFNMDDTLVGSPGGERSRKLRQAMSLVVDAREYNRIFSNGRGIAAQSPIPPGIFGHDDSYENPYRQVDIERAKQLLAEAGYPGGVDPKTRAPLRISFDTPQTAPTALMRYKFFVRAWRQIGLDVVIDATSYNQFQDKMRRNAYQVFMWGWIADYPDPENFLFLLWSESSPHPNSSRFKDERFDRLFRQMKARPNDQQRYDTIRQMVGIIEHERPWIELWHSESYSLFHSWLDNVKPAGLSIQLTKYRALDPRERALKREQWNEPVVWPLFALLGAFLLLVAPGVITFFRERQ